jgi:hypothetical protein
VGRWSDGREEHRNPFLSGADADDGATSGRSDKGRLAAIRARAIAVGRRVGHRVRGRRARAPAIALARPIVSAVGVMALVGIGVEGVAHMSSSSAPVRSSGTAETAISLERMKPALRFTVGNAFGEERIGHQTHRQRSQGARTHRAAKHPRARTPAPTTVAVHYTPSSSSGSGGSSGPSPSDSGSGSSTAGSSTGNVGSGTSNVGSRTTGSATSGTAASGPAQPAAQPAAASSTPKTSAFGAAGALGPGSSPNG